MTENEYNRYKRKKLQDRMEANRREYQELCEEQKMLDRQLAETTPKHTEESKELDYLPFLQHCLNGAASDANGTLQWNGAGCQYIFTWGDGYRYQAYEKNGCIFRDVTEAVKPASTEEIDERFQGKISENEKMCCGFGYF